MIGTTLAHYEIVAHLGQGGMGEVYRAHDTRLGRDVALKILPENFTDDGERVARFRREARTLASLHHANIASIHGIDEDQGRLFLVMELVEGEDLSERIARGALPSDEAIEIAIGIAQGLEAAHAIGVVHRDLKPANVKVAADGTAKVLDFGLARAIAGESVEESDIGTSPTITAAMTQAGTILGTAAYMSPEQARGRPVDHRADVWAFGVLLWEMLNGKRLFDGDTTSDVLANVLTRDIDPHDVPASTPATVKRVLARCLRRDPKQRLHAIADARIELEEPDAGDAPVAAPGSRSRLPWILVACSALVAAVFAWQPWAPPAATIDPREMAVSVNLPETLTLGLIDWSALAASPDGDRIALTARIDGADGIVLRDMRDGDLRVIVPEGRAYNVFFSPDGRWVGYMANNHFVKSSVDGGAPIEIVETAHPRGASWGDAGHLYFAPGYTTGIHRVLDVGNATPETLTTVATERGERTHRWPHALPGERGVVFTVGMTTSPGDYEDAELWILDLASGRKKDTGLRGAIAKYVPTGHLLFAREGTLHAVPFDLDALEVRGTAVPVHEGVRGDAASGMYYFDVDGAGNLYTVSGADRGPQRRLRWITRDGAIEPIDLEPGRYRYPRLDAARGRAALVLGEGHGNNDDVYLLDLVDLNLTRLSFDTTSIMPNWTPDFGALVYSSLVEGGGFEIRNMEGSAAIRRVPTSGKILIANDIGADARTLLATRLDASSPGDLVTFDLDTGEESLLLTTDAVEWAGSFAPDMEWFAYVSDETGREEIFVQPFPTTGAKWQISNDGGRAPRWSDDGTEIFYVMNGAMWSARIRTSPNVRIGTPERLFVHRMDDSGIPIPNYDVTPDGQRFLIVDNDRSTETRSIEIRIGWGRRLEETRF